MPVPIALGSVSYPKWIVKNGDIPDGLVGDDDLGPVLHFVGDGLELRGHDFDGLASLALLLET